MAEAQLAQLAIEVLSDSEQIVNNSYVAQLAIEVLSDSEQIVNNSYVAQLAIEVLSGPFNQWPHKSNSVASASISKVGPVAILDVNKILGVGL